MVTREMAVAAAAILKRHRWVYGVELFGSVARDGSGKDLDLIIISDDSRGSDFIELMEEYLKARPDDDEIALMGYDMENGVYADWRLRKMVAMRVLGEGFVHNLIEAGSRISGATIDLFVFPRTWRDHLRVLQDALPHEDPNFMENIARDAVSI
jgi:predicted nucleotidyltransferase